MVSNRKGMLSLLMIMVFSILILLINIKVWGNKKEVKLMGEYEPINSVTSVSSEKVRQITNDMNYYDIIDLLGQTKSVGSGFFILEYEVDNKYTLLLTFTKPLSQPAGFVGSDLLNQLLPKSNKYDETDYE